MMQGPREDSTSVERCFGHLRQMGNSMVGSCFAFFIARNNAAGRYFRNIPFNPAPLPNSDDSQNLSVSAVQSKKGK